MNPTPEVSAAEKQAFNVRYLKSQPLEVQEAALKNTPKRRTDALSKLMEEFNIDEEILADYGWQSAYDKISRRIQDGYTGWWGVIGGGPMPTLEIDHDPIRGGEDYNPNKPPARYLIMSLDPAQFPPNPDQIYWPDLPVYQRTVQQLADWAGKFGWNEFAPLTVERHMLLDPSIDEEDASQDNLQPYSDITGSPNKFPPFKFCVVLRPDMSVMANRVFDIRQILKIMKGNADETAAAHAVLKYIQTPAA